MKRKNIIVMIVILTISTRAITDIAYWILGDIEGLKFLVFVLLMVVASMFTVKIMEKRIKEKERKNETKKE